MLSSITTFLLIPLSLVSGACAETSSLPSLVGDCDVLTVALEIVSDLQRTLHAAIRGKAPVADIEIFDHPAYSGMPSSFADWIQDGRCLDVRAVDVPGGVPEGHDEWVENQVLALVKSATGLQDWEPGQCGLGGT